MFFFVSSLIVGGFGFFRRVWGFRFFICLFLRIFRGVCDNVVVSGFWCARFLLVDKYVDRLLDFISVGFVEVVEVGF